MGLFRALPNGSTTSLLVRRGFISKVVREAIHKERRKTKKKNHPPPKPWDDHTDTDTDADTDTRRAISRGLSIASLVEAGGSQTVTDVRY